MKRALLQRRSGIMGVDLIVTFALMAGMAALAGDAVIRYRHAQDEYFWRRAALLAADAQLKRYEAGAPLDSLPPAGMIPTQITLKTHREPARNDWRGFNRVTVVATAVLSNGQTAHEQISIYLPEEARP